MTLEERERLAARLRAARRAKRYTQRLVGSRIGRDAKRVYAYEGGETVPKVPVLLDLAAVYGVSVGWLLGEADEPGRA
jgi:transcriptional regulator with XRE-family HTH domain